MKPGALARTIAQAISDATQTLFELTAADDVSGGCIHASMKLSGEAAGEKVRYFAKSSEAGRAAMLEAEADGLEALHSAGAIRVPEVVTRGDDGDHAWLVLEWLELAPLDAHSAGALGTALARLHRVPMHEFGWGRDNFIGATPQANGWSGDWLHFWRHKRLLAQLQLAARNRLPSRMIDRGERLVADCGAFFRTHHVVPSLLHGDLWGGNAAALADGTPVVFDPAVYAGDREADVAMTELFGGFPRDFLAAYRAAWALDEGYGVRRDFYNLYHVLNHANLFAGGYVRQAEQTIERLLAEIA